MSDYDEVLGLEVVVHLHDGSEIEGYHLDTVADVYGSTSDQMLILTKRVGLFVIDTVHVLAIPTALVLFVEGL